MILEIQILTTQLKARMLCIRPWMKGKARRIYI